MRLTVPVEVAREAAASLLNCSALDNDAYLRDHEEEVVQCMSCVARACEAAQPQHFSKDMCLELLRVAATLHGICCTRSGLETSSIPAACVMMVGAIASSKSYLEAVAADAGAASAVAAALLAGWQGSRPVASQVTCLSLLSACTVLQPTGIAAAVALLQPVQRSLCTALHLLSPAAQAPSAEADLALLPQLQLSACHYLGELLRRAHADAFSAAAAQVLDSAAAPGIPPSPPAHGSLELLHGGAASAAAAASSAGAAAGDVEAGVEVPWPAALLSLLVHPGASVTRASMLMPPVVAAAAGGGAAGAVGAPAAGGSGDAQRGRQRSGLSPLRIHALLPRLLQQASHRPPGSGAIGSASSASSGSGAAAATLGASGPSSAGPGFATGAPVTVVGALGGGGGR